METPEIASGCARVDETPPEKILSSGIQLRASARVSKKLKLDQELALAQAPSPEKKCDQPTNNNNGVHEEKPRRRAPVLWSAEDKAAFFEALNEHGKNFDAIEKYMMARAKKRGEGEAKNREKARYFYYRAWHKLSRYVQFPVGVKKVTQELYALINFGELRKKVGHITEKNALKLNELMYSGSTQVRVRGKTWRIKTPVCRALRKLNGLDEDSEEVRLPGRVEVMLSPRSNRDKALVLATGHNPRARTLLPLETPLSSLLVYLRARWSSSTHQIHKREIRVGPRGDAVISQPHYRCGEVVTSTSVSLLEHERRVGGTATQVQCLLDQLHVSSKGKGALKKEKDAVSGVTDEAGANEFIDPLAPDQQTNQENQRTSSEEKDVKEVDKEEFLAQAREGWTEETSAKTRIGHLYMMMGSKGCLDLEYWWIDGEAQKQLTKALHRLASIARLYHCKAKVECPCGHKCKGGGSRPSGGDAAKTVRKPGGGHQARGGGGAVAGAAARQGPCSLPPGLGLIMGSGAAASGEPLTPVTASTTQHISAAKIELVRSCEDGGSGSFITEPLSVVSGTFKHPLLPAPLKQHSSTNALEAFKQLQGFRPKYCLRRGRTRSRGVVVQRMLPLLPKSASPPVMVALKVITPPQQPGATAPVTPPPQPQPPPAILQSSAILLTTSPTLTQQLTPGDGLDVKVKLEEGGTGMVAGPSGELPEREQSWECPVKSESTWDQNAAQQQETNSFRGILGGTGDSLVPELPEDDDSSTSPSRILKEGEGQWLNAEVSDFSLSSFLGHLESPLKSSNGATSNSAHASAYDDIHMSTDVESHFQSLMTESSLDYTAKFADLAEKIAGGAGPPQQ